LRRASSGAEAVARGRGTEDALDPGPTVVAVTRKRQWGRPARPGGPANCSDFRRQRRAVRGEEGRGGARRQPTRIFRTDDHVAAPAALPLGGRVSGILFVIALKSPPKSPLRAITVAVQTRASIRLAASFCAEACSSAVDLVHAAAGGSNPGNSADCPLFPRNSRGNTEYRFECKRVSTGRSRLVRSRSGHVAVLK
jgi:hypothetical protein